MQSSKPGSAGHLAVEASSSISTQNDPDAPSFHDDIDDDDILETSEWVQDTFSEDPLNESPSHSLPHKGKRKATTSFRLPRLLSSKFGAYVESSTISPSSKAKAIPRRRITPGRGDNGDGLGSPSNMNGSTEGGILNHDSREINLLDWNIEGPGRRVGYDDLTAIDWIFEYAKERQRLRILHSSATGFLGYLQQLADSSQIWLVLILAGIATGLVAGSIDVISEWLADLKTGYCKNGYGGGRFYLNKSFCCWGHEKLSDCQDWVPWDIAFGLKNQAAGWVANYFSYTFTSVVFAACASFLVQKFAIYAQHSGIPEIKTVLGGFVIRRFLGTWTLIIKSLGLSLAVASGLWLGKEGPLVHVACCCANLFLKVFSKLNNNEARKREVFSASAAAGISVAFGAPVGGVLFSLEQLSYYFPDKTMWQSFVCAMIAAVTLQLFNPFRTEKLVLYQVKYHATWHAFDLVPFIMLGIMGGLFGGLFIKLNMKIVAWRKSTQLFGNLVMEVAAVAFLTAFINFPNTFMRAQASELLYALFAECSELPDEQLGLCGTGAGVPVVVALLLSAAVLGFFLASITFGLQLPSGIILPSMAIGALYGRAIGSVVRSWHENYPEALIFAACDPDGPCVTAGTYAIVGAASALGGVTRMTVSIVVIMFELTGALQYVLPIMISVMISKWVGDAFGKRGIYESWIRFNEYPFLDNSNDVPIPDVAVSNIMTRIEDLFVIPATGHTIKSLVELLKTQAYRGFPVISSPREAVLLGYISRTELDFALKVALSAPRHLPHTAEAFFAHLPLADPRTSLDLRPWMDQTPITLSSNSSLQLTVNLFQKLGLRYVLFCDKGALQGLLTKKDVWYVLNSFEDEGSNTETNTSRDQGPSEGRGLLQSHNDETEYPISRP